MKVFANYVLVLALVILNLPISWKKLMKDNVNFGTKLQTPGQ